jgi:hypothetical protein
MLQQAIMASLMDDDPLTPMKSLPDEHNTLASVYNPIFTSQGTSHLAPLDVEQLPAAIHHDGYTVLGADEMNLIKNTTDGHTRFIGSSKQAPIIALLLDPNNIAVIDGFLTKSNIRECEIHQNFRLFDLMTLLSYRFTTDAVLTCCMHYLSSVYPNVYFMSPVVYKWMENYDILHQVARSSIVIQ